MVSTGVPSLDHILGDDGYPDRSSVLVVGPPGICKEVLGYWFVRSGLIQGDYCLYTTHRPVSDIFRDMKGVGIANDYFAPGVGDGISYLGFIIAAYYLYKAVMSLSPLGKMERLEGTTNNTGLPSTSDTHTWI